MLGRAPRAVKAATCIFENSKSRVEVLISLFGSLRKVDGNLDRMEPVNLKT